MDRLSSKNAVDRAKEIVEIDEWSADLQSNMTILIGAGRVLKKRLIELETLICEGTCNFQKQSCGECQQCLKVKSLFDFR